MEILERAPKGFRSSLIVVVWKPDEDLRICGDVKAGVNYKICSDSYPIPNIKTILHE